jgi:hypothetical protein
MDWQQPLAVGLVALVAATAIAFRVRRLRSLRSSSGCGGGCCPTSRWAKSDAMALKVRYASPPTPPRQPNSHPPPPQAKARAITPDPAAPTAP